MIDFNLILNNNKYIYVKMKTRNIFINLPIIFSLLVSRKRKLHEMQFLQRKKKNILKSKMNNAIKTNFIQHIREVIHRKKQRLFILENQVYRISLFIPNLVENNLVLGRSDNLNLNVKKTTLKRSVKFIYQNHVDIGINCNIIDISRGVKVASPRFVFLKKQGALLNRALQNYIMDVHLLQGDVEMNVPILARERSLLGTGQIPKFKDDLFNLPTKFRTLFLIPTAEVPLTNYYANNNINSQSLPIRFYAYSPCFRREAGTSSKSTQGMIRMHQFEKIEMVRFCDKPSSSFELKRMINTVLKILKALEIPCKIIKICSGDIGFSASETYDIEVWLPSRKMFYEISSCSVCSDFQSRRANIKYKDHQYGKNELAFTLNGSALPLGRTIVALLENHQNKNGGINIPKCLWSYTNGIKIIG